jgi:hypothetical protein
MDTSPTPPRKKGLGVFAWLGIGCGGLVLIVVVVIVVASIFFGPKLKEWSSNFTKDPTRATAELMVSVSRGQFEIVAQDEPNKRYTVRQKSNGALTTIYWDAKTQKPVVVKGDFSAIPANANVPSTPDTPAPK